MQRNAEKCREMQRVSEIQRNSKECREMQRNAEKCRYAFMTFMTHGNVIYFHGVQGYQV